MAENTLKLPIRLSNTEITSGDRGLPEVDFDFMNAVTQSTQTRTGELANEVRSAGFDLSTTLNSVHLQLKESRQKKRDSDLLLRTQVNDLANQSDAVMQNAMEANADPFNELKALFTDTPSMAEWGARQNAIQNQMNKAKRGHSATQAEHNFDLTEIASSLQFERQKLALKRGEIADITASAQAIATQVNTAGLLVNQQLDTIGTRPELVAEFEDPKGQLPKFLVRQRIEDMDAATAALSAGRSAAGKSALERKKLELEVAEKFPHSINPFVTAQVLKTGQAMRDPNTTIMVTPEIANITKIEVEKRTRERAEAIVLMTKNDLQGASAAAHSMGVTARLAEPGVAAFGYDENGEVTGVNRDSIPRDMQIMLDGIRQLQTAYKGREHVLAIDGVLTGAARHQAEVVQFEISRQIQEADALYTKRAIEEATLGVNDDQAKEAITQWITTGFIRNENGANMLLAESVGSSTPGLDTSSTQGPGYSAMMEFYSVAFKDEFDTLIGASGDLVDEDGNINSAQLLSSILSQTASVKDKAATASANAMRLVDGRQRNIMAAAGLNDWYEVAASYAIQDVMSLHTNEPETLKALQSLLMGDQALSNSVMHETIGDTGTELDGMLVLFGRLALLDQELHTSGALPEDASMLNEFRNRIMDKNFYNSARVVSLTRPKTDEASSINRILFSNNARGQFSTGLQQKIGAVPVADIAEQMEFVRLQNAPGVATGVMGGLNADGTAMSREQQRAAMDKRAKLQQMKDDGVSNASSMGGILQHLLIPDLPTRPNQ